jgi:hypothetical protein
VVSWRPSAARPLRRRSPWGYHRGRTDGWGRTKGVAKVVTRSLSATATYSWKYRPAARGAYRIRATVAKTATNLAAASTWRSFKVE